MTDAATLLAIAALITAVGGIVTPLLTVIVILRVNHVVRLTNSNFSAMQRALDEALLTNKEQAGAAIRAAKGASDSAIEVARETPPL